MLTRLVKGFVFGVIASAVVAAAGGWMLQFLPIDRQIAYTGVVRNAVCAWIASLPAAGLAGSVFAYITRPRS
jgi:hypothetical protein